MSPTDPSRRQQGFTLIEVLAALSIFLIVMMTVSGSLTGLFRSSGTSADNLSVNNQASTALEVIRTKWKNAAYYDRTCMSTGSLPAGVTVAVTYLTDLGAADPLTAGRTRAASSDSMNVLGNCLAITPDSPSSTLKRVTVNAGSGTAALTLTLDLAHP